MRCMALFASAAFLAAAVASAQDTPTTNAPPKLTKTPTQLPPAKAEPAESPGIRRSAPTPQTEGPTEADVGPVQKHFVRASTLDDLAATQNADNASLVSHEKIAIDKRISIPLIHDVQNDGAYAGSDNDALRL